MVSIKRKICIQISMSSYRRLLTTRGEKNMTDDNWKRSKNTIGAIGETYAQSMFLANGFAVYVPIVDNQGIGQ